MVSALLLSAEAQDELAERIILEWQSYIEEAHVLIPSVVGILHRIPHGDHIRMQVHIRLSSEGRIPEIGIPVTIGTHTTANHFSMILGHEQAGIVAVHQLSEKL